MTEEAQRRILLDINNPNFTMGKDFFHLTNFLVLYHKSKSKAGVIE